jgi:RimJ/RimL family protein N-acetyltransferase
MTDAIRRTPSDATDNAARFIVRPVRDRRALDRAMADDRAYAAYAVAQLEPGLFEQSRYWLAQDASGEQALLMHSEAGLGRAMVTVGAPAALDALLSLHPGPLSNYLATGAPEHLAVLDRHFRIEGALEMRRMSATAATFRHIEGEVRRLRAEDVAALNALYSTEGGPTGYTATHIERGVYYGAYHGWRLVAVAGTHVVAPNMGIAVVGNVFTHPAYRGGGLAKRVTSAVTDELLNSAGCALVVLTVNPMNTPAARAYEHLGYEVGAAVVEARLQRRDTLGLGAMFRRWAARRAARGGTPGDEVTTGQDASPLR